MSIVEVGPCMTKCEGAAGQREFVDIVRTASLLARTTLYVRNMKNQL